MEQELIFRASLDESIICIDKCAWTLFSSNSSHIWNLHKDRFWKTSNNTDYKWKYNFQNQFLPLSDSNGKCQKSLERFATDFQHRCCPVRNCECVHATVISEVVAMCVFLRMPRPKCLLIERSYCAPGGKSKHEKEENPIDFPAHRDHQLATCPKRSLWFKKRLTENPWDVTDNNFLLFLT